ncbi:hypothetical protein PR048_021335 [Dryococelus australis]|uniref:Uncharacterized protein n=1 Tax=Dryococelus australis TaxID=614101 RepID=A0ABQ9GXX3_9NEOP|nr:hypothetical protein PR048_021335 [Dryococelus australis]
MASQWVPNRIKCVDYGHVHKKVFYKTSKRPDFIVVGDISDVFSDRFPNDRVNPNHHLCSKFYYRLRESTSPLAEHNVIPQCECCELWLKNTNTAVDSYTIYNQKVQAMSIVPRSVTKQKILENIPNPTKYTIGKSRRVVVEKGILGIPDPYSGHTITDKDLRIAVYFSTDDTWYCKRQSASKNDTHKNLLREYD